ncbi:Ima1 N-terminal domain-containing protein [Rhodocollybia butyracea]|uniref:Ima1 N-terminal domain-containing protein n=1 Tax=Rhodocollybia butyracea TaxID=206335 RepID=A0A9P5Q7L4_9AGAR|nr:Ima1 N-terminal domain-containing protein [Rhodocollybia butyracea]
MFKSSKEAQCYFCNSFLPLPRDPKNFRCRACGCWNRYDSNGEILSDEPAMHEESLNSKSFLKRASPSKDRFLTSYGKGTFCHNCETNQHLIVNLLSNYLPSPTSPEYEQRLEMLPQYRESLHIRYPPVCESCLPAVEDEIQRKDAMARSQALGGWLKETKGKARQRRVSATLQEREKVSKELFVWRVRGVLWAATLMLFVVGYTTTLLGFRPFHRLDTLQPLSPLFILLSILWTAWDPTYSSIRTAQMQGREVRVHGKRSYNVLQMLLWVSRLITATLLALQRFHRDYLHTSERPLNLTAKLYFLSFLALEFSVRNHCINSIFFCPARSASPTIRLINSKSYDLGASRSPTPNPNIESSSRANSPSLIPQVSDPDLFATLTLSSQPVVQKNPVFGLPSLLASVPPSAIQEEDEMDWSPTNPNSNSIPPKKRTRSGSAEDGDGSWLRPQRFFAPEKPTGLESLFEKTKLVDDVPMRDGTGASRNRSSNSKWHDVITHLERWGLIYAAVSVLLLGVLLKMWINRASARNLPLHDLSYEDIDDPIRRSDVYRHLSPQ